MSSAITYLCIDSPCTRCGARPRLRVCAGCDAKAIVTECGHMSQPRPIRSEPGRNGLSYCNECRDEYAATVPS